jgi:hypothetical protein
MVGDRKIRLYEASLDSSAPTDAAAAGTIVSIDGDGMRISLAGSTLKIGRVRIDPNPKKVAPAELAAAGELAAGTRLM